MAENPYLSKELPFLKADIFGASEFQAAGAQTRLKLLQSIINGTSHIQYQADPLVAMSSAEYHQLYVQDYLMLIQASIYENVSQNQDCRFILLHYDFIYNHFFKIVSRYPHNPEPGLVTDTIIELVYEFYDNGLPIDFSRDSDRYGAEPQGIFSSPDEILDFYQAVRGLYEGDSEKYLAVSGNY